MDLLLSSMLQKYRTISSFACTTVASLSHSLFLHKKQTGNDVAATNKPTIGREKDTKKAMSKVGCAPWLLQLLLSWLLLLLLNACRHYTDYDLYNDNMCWLLSYYCQPQLLLWLLLSSHMLLLLLILFLVVVTVVILLLLLQL